MSPESTTDQPEHQVDVTPTRYLEGLREVMQDQSTVVKAAVPPKVGAQMYFEEEKSRAFLAEEGRLTEYGEEEAGWINEAFPALMARMVKITARADMTGYAITSFADLDSDAQDALRAHTFEEYIELTKLLTPADKPSKPAYDSPAFFYTTPEEAKNIIEDNADLGRGHVARMVQRGSMRVGDWIEGVRDSIDEAAEKFPTVPYNQIKLLVIGAPNSYETSIKNYAKKQGIVLKPKEELVPAGDFLTQVRTLIQAHKYNLGHLNPPPELVEKARKIGQEAVTAMDVTVVEVEGLDHGDLSDPVLMEGYQNKVEWLVWAANRAWRHGDLPLTPERAPEEFRQELYAEMLGDFLKIHVTLGSNISEISMRDNLVLHMDPEEVARVLGENSDITMNYVRTLMRRNPGRPDEAIQDFRDRVSGLMEANPRLLYHEAVDLAFNKPKKEIKPEPEELTDKMPPNTLLGAIRDYLRGTSRLGKTRSRDIVFEIDERRPEIEGFFESRDWDFGDINLPEAGREALIHKVEEFIVANERAHRKKEINTRLRDYNEEERLTLYGILATEYVAIASILDPRSNIDWSRNPVLYVGAEEITQMRADYSWMTDNNFRRVVMAGVRDVSVALDRATQLRSDLQRWYPGISDALASNLAVTAPVTGPERFVELLRKKTERNAARRDSRTEIPNPGKPDEMYKYLMTLCRHDELDIEMPFDKAVEEQITELKTRAATLIKRQDKTIEIDEDNLKKLLGQLEFYARGSHTQHVHDERYPSILNLSASVQNHFISSFYENYRTLNTLISGDSEQGKFRTYDFAFFHDTNYMQSLWREYIPYMSQKIITFAALTSPRRPFDALNDLVERRGELMRANPDITPAEINKGLLESIRNRRQQSE